MHLKYKIYHSSQEFLSILNSKNAVFNDTNSLCVCVCLSSI